LVRGKYRCKIAYSKHELNRNTKKNHVETLRELSTVMKFQQHLGKEFEVRKRTSSRRDLCRESTERDKRSNSRSSRTNNRLQLKPDRIGWFDEECRLETRISNFLT
jgi:hypothetical protein